MARGNGRQTIFHIDGDYQRMTDGLAKTVARTGWEVFAYVWMPNHFHLVFRSRPNVVGVRQRGTHNMIDSRARPPLARQT
jgi:REP element-mobilizing transposase RayT